MTDVDVMALEWTDRIELGDETYVAPRSAETRIRGGGLGVDAWLARITGPHPKFVFEREFLRADRSRMSRSGRSGAITWEIEDDGLYEWRGFCIGCKRLTSGFGIVRGDQTAELTRRQAIEVVQDNRIAEVTAAASQTQGCLVGQPTPALDCVSA